MYMYMYISIIYYLLSISIIYIYYLYLYLYLYANCCVRPRRSQALASPSFRPMLPALGKPHAEGAAPSAAGAAPPLVLIEFPCLAVYTNKVRPRRLGRRCAINPVRANCRAALPITRTHEAHARTHTHARTRTHPADD